MVHQLDAAAWQYFDMQYPDKAKDARNVRSHSNKWVQPIWNTCGLVHLLARICDPPQSCPDVMFEPNNVLLSLIIPGYPGNNMGVFMQPPWDELEHAWKMGVALEPQLSWPGGVPARPTQEVASDPLPTRQIGSAWVYNSTL